MLLIVPRDLAAASVEGDVAEGEIGGLDLFFFKQKTAYEISSRDWSSDVCSSDLVAVSRMDLPEARQRWPRLKRALAARGVAAYEIGRASCRERVCELV